MSKEQQQQQKHKHGALIWAEKQCKNKWNINIDDSSLKLAHENASLRSFSATVHTEVKHFIYHCTINNNGI